MTAILPGVQFPPPSCGACGKPAGPSPKLVVDWCPDLMYCSERCLRQSWTELRGRGWEHWRCQSSRFMEVSWMRRPCVDTSRTYCMDTSRTYCETLNLAIWDTVGPGSSAEPGKCGWTRCGTCQEWQIDTVYPVGPAHEAYLEASELLCSPKCYQRREARLLLEGWRVYEPVLIRRPISFDRYLGADCIRGCEYLQLRRLW